MLAWALAAKPALHPLDVRLGMHRAPKRGFFGAWSAREYATQQCQPRKGRSIAQSFWNSTHTGTLALLLAVTQRQADCDAHLRRSTQPI